MYKLMMKYVSITKKERTACAWVWAYHSNGDSNVMYPVSYILYPKPTNSLESRSYIPGMIDPPHIVHSYSNMI